MKNKIVLFASIFSRFAGLTAFLTMGLLFSGCTNSTTTTPSSTPNCSVGTTVNIGSTTGGTFYTSDSSFLSGSSGGTWAIYFDNITLNFYVLNFSDIEGTNYSNQGTIMDQGSQSCPDFSYTGAPTAALVAYQQGHGYVGVYADGHIVKFVAGADNNGVVTVNYIFQ